MFYDGSTGRITRVRYTNGANANSVYLYHNDMGRPTKITDWTGGNGFRYAFDAGGRLTQLTDYDDSTLTYAYDASGNVTTMTDWHGNATTYTYTDTNLLSTMTAPGSKVWTYTYNALGQPSQVALPNGMTTEYAYDGRNRLTKIEHKDGSTVLDGFTYSLDTGGNITKTTHEDSKYWDYLYDGHSRLTSAVKKNADSSTAATYTYTYDAGDNLVTKVEAGTTTTLAYDALKLTAMTSGGTTTNLSYDDWGRQVSKYQSGSYSATYAYRYDDKLYSITSSFSGEGNMTNDYDGTGKLRSITAGGSTTKLRWDGGWHVVNREDSGGALTDTFINDPAFQAAGSVLAAHVGSDPSSGGTWNYLMKDIINSTRSIRGGDKSQLGATEFTPYGGIYSSSGTDLPQKFTGHWWMPQADTYYAPHRMYSPGQARWTMRDPIGMADGPNVYGYARSNPILHGDPSGLYAAWLTKSKNWIKEVLIAVAAGLASKPCGVDLVEARKDGLENWNPANGGDTPYVNYMRHCTTSCNIAKVAPACAYYVGYAYEIVSGEYGRTEDSNNDVGANHRGARCGGKISVMLPHMMPYGYADKMSCTECCNQGFIEWQATKNSTPPARGPFDWTFEPGN